MRLMKLNETKSCVITVLHVRPTRETESTIIFYITAYYCIRPMFCIHGCHWWLQFHFQNRPLWSRRRSWIFPESRGWEV